MKKSVAVSAIAILLTLSIVLVALYFANNSNKKKEIEQLISDAADKASLIETLSTEMTDKERTIESLSADVSDKTDQIETLKAEVDEKADQIEKLNVDVASKSSQIETLNANVSDKTAQIGALNEEITQKDSQIDMLDANISDKAGQIETLTEEMSGKVNRIETLKMSIADKAGQIETLNGDIAKKTNQIEELNAVVLDKTAQIETLNGDITQKDTLIETLNTNISDKASRIEKLNGEISQKADQIEALKKDVADEAGEIEALNTNVIDKLGQIEILTAEVENKVKQIEILRVENEEKDNQIKVLSTEAKTKEIQIKTLNEENNERDNIIKGLSSVDGIDQNIVNEMDPIPIFPKDRLMDVPEETDAVKDAVEEKEGKTGGVGIVEFDPFTMNGKVVLNTQNVSMFATMFAQGNPERLEKINNLIRFINDLDYRIICDGVDIEGFISLRGENLASYLALREPTDIIVMTDIIPSYSFNFSLEDLLSGVSGVSTNDSPQKLVDTVLTSVMGITSRIEFGEPEQIEETICDTVFTSKIPINISTKELALLGLNTAKEILEQKEFASLLDYIRETGLDFSVEKLDQTVKSMMNARDEDFPILDAAAYTNEKQDMIIKAVFTQDEQEVICVLGSVADETYVFEYQTGDQLHITVNAGTKGVLMNIRVSGMDICIDVVPETRADNDAVTATFTFSGMELLTADVEIIKEAEMTGSFDTANKTEITIRDLKEKKTDLAKELVKDASANYKPVLKEKLQKVAPDMLTVFASLKRLVKENSGMVVEKIKTLE